MKSERHRIRGHCLLGLILVLGLSAVCIDAAPSKEETAVFQTAKQTLDDGLFELTSERIENFFKKYPNSDYKWEGRLIQARALYYLGRYDDAAKVLGLIAKGGPDKIKDEIMFWMAENSLAREHWNEAETQYKELLSSNPAEELQLSAQLGLTWSLVRQKKDAEAQELIKTLSKNPPGSRIYQQSQLIKARLLIARNQSKEASQTLETLLENKSLKQDMMYEANYWLGELRLQNNRWNDAQACYLKIISDPKAFPKELVAKAWFGLATAQTGLGEHEKAAASYEKVFTLSSLEPLKLAAFRHFLISGKSGKRLGEYVTKLQDYASKLQDKTSAGAALYAIAMAQSENDEEVKAIATLEALLIAYPNNRWKVPALLHLGRLYQNQNKFTEALQCYQKVVAENTDPVTTSQTHFEMGQIHFRRKEPSAAIGYFEKAASLDKEIAERSIYNVILAYAQLGQVDGFMKSEEKFNKDFPNSPLKEKVILERAQLLQRLGKLDEAQSTYEKAIAQGSKENLSALQLRLADLLYKTQKFEQASQLYEQVASQSNDDPLFAEAAYKAIFAGMMIKKISADQALEALQALVKRFPNHNQTPGIMMSIGELYFQKQDYLHSQEAFEKLLAQYPKSDLADEALYWSGRAAVGRADLTGAIVLLEKIPDNAPMKSKARLLQGRIYHQQAKFENAVQLFDAVLGSEKTGPIFVEASLRKGDCLLALGGSDPTKFEAASTTYNTILESNFGDLPQRNEAAFKRAKCLEKMNRREEALSLYLDIVNNRIIVPPPGTVDAPEYLWRIKAGLEAANLKQNTQDWKGALAIYRRLEELGGPNQQEFRDAINRIKRDNFIYDEET